MRFPRLVLCFLALSWVLVMLYPDPAVLVRSVRNTLSPRIDSGAVATLAAQLPNDPKAIETYVLERQVPYAYDWQSASVPWYFPTTAEALRAGRGDCESRALILASILTAKGIPNELRMSLDHIWVQYPGKVTNALENPGVELAGRRNGRFFLHWPADFHLGQEIDAQLAMYWDPAPRSRVLILLLGLTLIPLWNSLAWLCAGGRLGAFGGGRVSRSSPALGGALAGGAWPGLATWRGRRGRPRRTGLAARPQRV